MDRTHILQDVDVSADSASDLRSILVIYWRVVENMYELELIMDLTYILLRVDYFITRLRE